MHSKEKLIIDLYSQGHSYIKIQSIAKVTPRTIQKILENSDLTIRKKEPYEIDLKYFEKIDSHRKAYFLGLIMADGCVVFNRRETRVNKLTISLQERDGYLIDELKSDTKFNGPIIITQDKRPNRQKMKTMTIHNGAFVSNFAQYGIGPRKSISHSFFKNVPKEFLTSAILGYFDGDGSVSFLKNENRLCISLISSIEFSKELGTFLLESGVKNSVAVRKTTNGYLMGVVKVKGNKQGLKFHELIYKDCDIFLKRKKEKFEFVIAQQSIGKIKNTN